MSDSKGVTFDLKVMINKQKTKVLFAEVDSNFADVLLSFLTLPLGKVVRVLKKHYGDEEAPVIGSLTTLYDGLANIDSPNFWTEGCKKALLNPRSSFEAKCRKLKLDISDPRTVKYFSCENWNCKYRYLDCETGRCHCGKMMNRVVGLKEAQAAEEDGAGGVFTKNTASFVISDDLRMVPNVAVSFLQTLSVLGITDTDGAELRNLTFGFNEIMDLLKGSLVSRTPLSDLILNRGKVDNFARLKYEPGILFHKKEKLEASTNSKKINLRLVVQKSTNKLLFAQAEQDFVDFLLILIAIPLGTVECLLGSNTCLKSIDNLYRSIADLIDDKYLVTSDTKNALMKPKLPRGYISKNTILPLSEQDVLYYHQDLKKKKEWLSYSRGNSGCSLDSNYLEDDNYVRGTIMYMVADDLTVTPLTMTSSLSVLKEMKIPLSDVKEVEVNIGLQEALSILKASLTSTSALTNGLKINPMSNKKPKREH